MNFGETIKSGTVVLTEGSIIERIRREPGAALDPFVDSAALVRDRQGRELLAKLYRGYLDVAREAGRPMIVLAPTWRANPERVARAGCGDTGELNRDCVEFVSEIRDEYADISDKIFVGGLMACKNDAYRADEALGENEAETFHQHQASILASTGVDFVLCSTLPARSEAIGIARALAKTGVSYVLSFIVRADGRLLDGSWLGETIETIDAGTSSPPLFCMLNCVHPSVCEQAMSSTVPRMAAARGRVLGLQANTSRRSPEELEGLEGLDSEEPAAFARGMIRVHTCAGINILGGCCGTDERHIRAIAEQLSEGKS